MQKAKRKRKRKSMTGFTCLMFGMAVVAAGLYAFHEPRLIYTLMSFGGIGWCMMKGGCFNV